MIYCIRSFRIADLLEAPQNILKIIAVHSSNCSKQKTSSDNSVLFAPVKVNCGLDGREEKKVLGLEGHLPWIRQF